jgi:hypothetical protein
MNKHSVAKLGNPTQQQKVSVIPVHNSHVNGSHIIHFNLSKIIYIRLGKLAAKLTVASAPTTR